MLRAAALKLAVDRRRTPGRFLLTDSANVLLLPQLADSLAGRMTILRLHPLAQCELARWPGGYPAALARPSVSRRSAWYRDYADYADDVRLLERVFLLERLPPWHSNRLSRLVKMPTLHLGDTGLACAPLGLDGDALRADRSALGHLLETFVSQELRRQGGTATEPHEFFHFRDGDRRGLSRSAQAPGGCRKRFACGAVLCDGEASGASFGDRLYAVAIRSLWEPA